MCLALLALDVHPRYAVVLAANRDEFHARAALAADWWRDPPILAGRDQVAGGTSAPRLGAAGSWRPGSRTFVTNA